MRVNYPILGLAVTDDILLISGGGGSAKTGIENAVDVYTLLHTRDDEKLFHKTMSLDTNTHLVCGIAVSPDGTLMALSVEMSCWIFEIDRKESTLELVVKFRTDFAPCDSEQSCVAFIGNSILATGGQDGVVRIWKLFRHADTKSIPTSKVLTCLLGTTTVEKEDRIEPPTIGNQLTLGTNIIMLSHEYRGHSKRIRQIAVDMFSRNMIATSAQDQSCHLWRISDLQRVHKFQFPTEEIPEKSQFRCIRFADFGNTIYTVLSPPRGCSFMAKWTPQHPIQKLDHEWPWTCTACIPIQHDSPVGSIALSFNNRLIALGSAAGDISVVRADTLELHKSCVGHDFAVTGLAFVEKTDTEYVLISAGADKAVLGHRVPLDTQTETSFLQTMGNTLCMVLTMAFSSTIALSAGLLLFGVSTLYGLEPFSGFQDIQQGHYESNEAMAALIVSGFACICGTGFLLTSYHKKNNGVSATLAYGLRYNGFAYALLVFVAAMVKKSTPQADELAHNVSVVLAAGVSLAFLVAHATVTTVCRIEH